MGAHTIDRPALPGVTSEFISISTSDSKPPVRMHVMTAGQGQPLLLLHGAPQNHLAWAGLVTKFAEHYRVVCPDLRGAGWTDAPGHGYDPVSLVNDLKTLMQAYDVSRVNIIAHDWGAIIAFLLATEHPAMIERLVILSIPDLFVKPDFGVVKLMKAGWFELILPLPVLGPLTIRFGRQSVLRYMHSLTGSRFHGALPYAELDRRLLRDPHRARDLSRLYHSTIIPTLIGLIVGRYRHRSLRVPTLQLMGAEDPATALMHMGRYEGRTNSLYSAEISGSAHFLIDEAAEEICRRSLEFFKRSDTVRNDFPLEQPPKEPAPPQTVQDLQEKL